MKEKLVTKNEGQSTEGVSYAYPSEKSSLEDAEDLPLLEGDFEDILNIDLPGLFAVKDVRNHVRIGDRVFEDRVDKLGQKYVDSFLEATALLMGHEKVRAYELHDQKDERMAEAFANVDKHFLPELDESEVLEHISGITDVLKMHDVVEDGVRPVREGYQDFELDVSVDSDLALTDDIWKQAYERAEEYAEGIGIRSTTQEDFISPVDQVSNPNSFAANHIECYAVHTQLFERPGELEEFYDYWSAEMSDYEVPEEIRKNLQGLEEWQRLDQVGREAVGYMAEKAFESRKILYSHFSGYPLESEENRRHAKSFVDAVFSHDRHTEEEQVKNIFRMAETYSEMLENKI